MGTWSALMDELDAWSVAGRKATMWWRDDDATRPAPALERLLDTAEAHGAPLCLAVIPGLAREELPTCLERDVNVAVAVHGVSHENFAAAGEKKCELADSRSPRAMADELVEGREKIVALTGRKAIPILAPPWNRISRTLVPLLPECGFRGLSTHGDRRTGAPVPGLRQVNCHVDPVDWRGGRDFIGVPGALEQVIGHLARRRRGLADAAEPTGLLTHHAVWSDAAFGFLRELLVRTGEHPAACWLTPRDVFGLEP